jgi:hypothetical protein
MTVGQRSHPVPEAIDVEVNTHNGVKDPIRLTDALCGGLNLTELPESDGIRRDH